MAGCFGNSFWDRAMERQLNQYLDSQDAFYCDNCGYEGHIDDDNIGYDEDTNEVICPKCAIRQEL